MIKGGVGGTNTKTGAAFEVLCDLKKAFNEHSVYSITGDNIVDDATVVGTLYQKHKIYSNLLEPRGIDWTKIISKKLLPDEAVLSRRTNVITILEKKCQTGEGSVDEKLQTCDFKKRQYARLFAPVGIDVQFAYLLNDWYKKPCYQDVLDYIQQVGCSYFFDNVPVPFFRL